VKLTEVSSSKAPQFKGEARSIEKLLASIKNGRFTLDGRKLVVRGDLSLTGLGLTSLLGCPRYVSGEFDCSNNELKTLEGAPQEVGSFDCSHNKLFSLEGGPQKVKKNFNCCGNKLKTLIGAPQKIGRGFDCTNNNIQTLKGGPQEVGAYFICDFNKLETLEGGPIKVGAAYSCSNNKLISLKGAPHVVDGDFYCSKNQLTSLEGCPRIIGGSFHCEKNKLLTTLEGGPRYVGDDVDFHGCTNLISLQNVHLHFPKVDGKFYLDKTGHKASVLGLLLIQQLEGVALDNLEAAAILNKYIETRNRDLLACAMELISAGYEDEAKL
jgi:hypothetical protein